MPDEVTKYDNTLTGISTGSLAVDSVTGVGGFPRGRLSEVFGWEGSGKTILCLMACAQAQRDGLFCAYVDPEHGVDLSLARRIGFDHEDERVGVYYTPQTFEQTVKIVHELILTGEVPLIIVDSVPAMVPESEMEGEIEAIGAVAERARKLAYLLPKITKLIKDHNTALVMVNQMRMKIETGFMAKFQHIKEQSSGGSALKFYSSLRLSLRVTKEGVVTRKRTDPWSGKEEDVSVANLHEVKAFKNKVSIPYRKATFQIRYDAEFDRWGIDNIQSILDLAVSQGLIDKKSGGHMLYKGDHNFSTQGMDRAYAHLIEHPEVVAELRTRLGL